MRSIAKCTIVSLEPVRRSYSRSSRRYPPNHSKVHSTIHRFGSTENPVSSQEEAGILIQVKRQDDPVGPDPVREVFSACAFYEKKFDVTFNEKLVVSSAPNYTRGAHELASENDVVLINREDLGRRIETHEPTIKGVREQEQRRMESL